MTWMDYVRLTVAGSIFVQVHVFKPVASKAGNSEQYVICLGFKKLTKAHLDKLQLGFSEDPLNCTHFYVIFLLSIYFEK